MIPCNTFSRSRNSNMSFKSNEGKSETDILVATYGMNQSSHASLYPTVKQIPNRQHNGSIQQSSKNSQNNTKTSFGFKQTATAQDNQFMEVRGNNLGGGRSQQR